jgi:ferredoxin
MRVHVDQLRCRTAGECVKRCPEVFRFQEGSKRAEVLFDPVPPALRRKCAEAADHCPNRAIVVLNES